MLEMQKLNVCAAASGTIVSAPGTDIAADPDRMRNVGPADRADDDCFEGTLGTVSTREGRAPWEN